MKADKIHIIMCLLAALAVTIAGVVLQTPLVMLARQLVLAILVFFVLGLILRAFLLKGTAAVPDGLPEPEDDTTDK